MPGFNPKGLFERKFHYGRLETENYWAGLGGAREIRWAVQGLIAGVILAALPFYDMPLTWGGIAFSAGGVALAGISLFGMIRRANIKEAQDNERVYSKDGDPAP
ncbi:MAG TPA: hypothetical protein VHA35_06090 [Dongiaceae bacterium]|nr:hypothetical protein [Dongiaceae bacterium]